MSTGLDLTDLSINDILRRLKELEAAVFCSCGGGTESLPYFRRLICAHCGKERRP